MRNLVNLLLCITDHEAVCLGIFLGDTLDLVGRWRSDKKVYAEEAESKPTFVVSWEPGKENSKTNFDQVTGMTAAVEVLGVMASHVRACLACLVVLGRAVLQA